MTTLYTPVSGDLWVEVEYIGMMRVEMNGRPLVIGAMVVYAMLSDEEVIIGSPEEAETMFELIEYDEANHRARFRHR